LSTARKKRREVSPDGLGIELVARGRRALEQFHRQQIGALREGDEQDAVENFLRGLDRFERGQIRAVGRMDQEVDQPFAQRLVIGIERS